MTLPFVVCLCPTYRRPALLENAIACFERQDYPADRRTLMICDDANEIPAIAWRGVFVYTKKTRFGSLCEKYNNIVATGPAASVYFVWEDDDVYLPGHISSHVNAYLKANAIGKPAWCKPPYVWTTHPREHVTGPWVERADGRFHASISMTREMLDAVGGWPDTKASNFDQQFMANMRSVSEPLTHEPPWGYCFRWQDTNAYHGQAFGDDWWDRIPQFTTPQPRESINPKLDDSAIDVFKAWERA